jgi:hypothetical protein
MGKELIPDVAAVTRFVREVIGCNCPDEVFRHIEIQRGSSAVKACSVDCELRIGGRLLMVVTSEPLARLAPHLADVVTEGKRARDERKFNRFRLVVRAEKPAEEREEFFRAFASASDKDERTHLHVLPKGEVPGFFSHALNPD